MVAIRVTKTWEYWLDEKGDTKRILPAGNVYDIETGVAAAAIAEGFAQPVRTPDAELAAAIEKHRVILDSLAAGLSPEEAYMAAYGDGTGADSVSGGNGTAVPAVDPPPPVVRAKLIKATVVDGERYAKGVEVEGELASKLIADGHAVAIS